MAILAKNKKQNKICYSESQLPKVAIVIAAYNEEKIIREKIESSLKANYPKDLLQIFIGSDCSSDQTNKIVAEYAAKNDQISFLNYTQRRGKQEVLNQILDEAVDDSFELCIMTDANILFEAQTIFELVKHFKNKQIGIVCSYVNNYNIKEKGISKQEQYYISNENNLKYYEGKVFNSSIAAFGACYAIRRTLIPQIPQNILMEDFYISMHVLSKKYNIITEPKAICFEDLPENISEEFKRKQRISTGNFQNLYIYLPLLFKARFGIRFSFISHKIIRWLGPFFILLAYLSLWVLSANSFYFTILSIAHIIICFSILDFILMSININVNLLRLLRYFFTMNIALFLGFINFAKGVKTNIWQPTKRNE